jgi:hypothetical protein
MYLLAESGFPAPHPLSTIVTMGPGAGRRWDDSPKTRVTEQWRVEL